MNIAEIGSAHAPEIEISKKQSQTILLENLSNRQFKIFGHDIARITGKLIQNRAFSRKMIFKESRGVTQTDI